jgi:hypothetical protein
MRHIIYIIGGAAVLFGSFFITLWLTKPEIAGTPQAVSYRSSVSPGSQVAQFDVSSQTAISIADGGNAIALPTGQGMLVVTLDTTNLAVALFFAGGGVVQLISPLGQWVAQTTAPAAGHTSLTFDGTANYRIYNKTGATHTFKVLCLQTG